MKSELLSFIRLIGPYNCPVSCSTEVGGKERKVYKKSERAPSYEKLLPQLEFDSGQTKQFMTKICASISCDFMSVSFSANLKLYDKEKRVFQS